MKMLNELDMNVQRVRHDRKFNSSTARTKQYKTAAACENKKEKEFV